MTILVVSAAFPPMRAGEATNAFHFSEELARRGVSVEVLTSVGNMGHHTPGVRVHPIMRSWSWDEVPRLLRCVRSIKPDAIYIVYLGWTYNDQFMSTFLPTLMKRAVPGVTVVTRFENIGGGLPKTNSTASRVIRRAWALLSRRGDVDYQFGTLLRDSDAVVLLSSRHIPILEQHLRGVGSKCVVIPPSCNMRVSSEPPVVARQIGRERLGISPGEQVVVNIGFIYPGKGIETLLRGFALLSESRPNARLVVIGGSIAREFPDHPNYADTLKALAGALGIADRVIWTGEYRSDSDDASHYLRAGDVCALPFDTGVKLNNSSFSSATAHGLPIITTYDDKLEPQFVDRENVLLCRPLDPARLAAALGEVLDDADLRQTLAQGAEKFAGAWYAWEPAMAKTIALLQGGTPESWR